MNLMKKDRKFNVRKIMLEYWRLRSLDLDPEQEELGQASPVVIKDKRDWYKYTNSAKLMVNNYHHMRNKSKCE